MRCALALLSATSDRTTKATTNAITNTYRIATFPETQTVDSGHDGRLKLRSVQNTRFAAVRFSSHCSLVISLRSKVSPPWENTSPVPVKMTARTERLASSFLQYLNKADPIAPLSLFLACGRLRVRMAIRPSDTYSSSTGSLGFDHVGGRWRGVHASPPLKAKELGHGRLCECETERCEHQDQAPDQMSSHLLLLDSKS